jgi:DNA-binding CsgD family transcriptional regulator
MDDIAEIIRRRSIPRILIFNPDNTLSYSNKEASRLISDLPDLYEAVCNICGQINAPDGTLESDRESDAKCMVYRSSSSSPFSIRTFVLGKPEDNDRGRILVLIEKVIEKRAVDLRKAGIRFLISKRELEVLSLICEGLTNREISEKLFISEQTVKDHVRHIMRKVGVKSRSSLIRAVQ